MIEHFQNDDFERYVSSEISSEYLQWFEEAQSHLERCDECRKKLERKLVLDLLFDDINMLPAGIKMLKEVKAAAIPKHGYINKPRFGSDGYPYSAAASMSAPHNTSVPPAAKSDLPSAASPKSDQRPSTNKKKKSITNFFKKK